MSGLRAPDVQNGNSIKPGDIVIAVMGVTGAGKTTFINHFTQNELAIGHGLESCTSQVGIFPCVLLDGTKFYLVDTPGFDDTYKTDVDILCEVASWLSEAYSYRIDLAGIVYLHQISDIRMGGSGMKNFRVFKKLCGDNTLASVVLATTMWNLVNPDEAIRREHELKSKPDFWKYMIDQGSTVFRQNQGKDSAVDIIKCLVKKRRPVTLDIQRDMVDKDMTLDQTAAGLEVQGEIAKQRKMYEKKMETFGKEMQDAMKEKDRERQEELKEYKAEIEAKIAYHKEELKKMQVSKDEIRERLRIQHEKERQELQEKLRENDLRIGREEHNLGLMKQRKIALVIAEIKLEREKKERIRLEKRQDESCAVM